MALVKLSILATYLRTFTIGRIRPIIRIVMAILMAMSVASIFAIVFQCVPVRGNFFQSEFKRPGDHCINGWALQYSISSLIIAIDLVVLVLPIKNIWGTYE